MFWLDDKNEMERKLMTEMNVETQQGYGEKEE